MWQATATPSAGENAVLEQHIESQNTTHLNYGSSSGKYIVLSFWVRSNKTGTYGLQLLHNDKNRNFINSYTISSADTWEKKTIVINPDTAGAAFDDDNLAGFRVIWHLSTGPDDILSGNRDWTDDGSFRSVTGQVNLFDSTSNEFYITGVQLEVGSSASEFEHRSFAEELALCQRYFQKIELNQYQSPMILRGSNSNVASSIVHMLNVAMRDNFTTAYTGDVTAAYWSNIGNTTYSTETVKFYITSRSSGRGYAWGISEASFVGNNELVATANYSSSQWLYLDAEL